MIPRLGDLKPYLALFRPYLWWIAGGLGLAVATLAGSWGLLALSGGFLTATALAGLVPVEAALFNVVIPAGAIRLFALMRVASRWGERVVNHEATLRLLGQLRVRLYSRLSRLSPRQLGLWHGGEVLNRLTKDVDHLDNLFIRVLVPIGAATTVLAILVAVLAAFHPVLAWPAALVALAGLVVVPGVVYLPGRILSPRLVQRQAALRRGLLDLVEGLEEWALHRPSWDRQRTKVLAEDAARLDDQMAVQRLGSAARAAVTLFIGLGVTALMALVAGLPPGGKAPDGPWFVALTLMLLGIGEGLLGLPAAWIELPGTALSARRMTDLADQRPDPAYPDAAPAVTEPSDLVLAGVGFRYEDDQPLLEDLSFSLPLGTHAALVGPSGEGKTTLVRLLTRLEDPTEGTIALAGRHLTDWPEPELRRRISCTMQDPWSFTETVAANLRLADPEATDEALWNVLEVVGLADQVRAWPEGLKTWVEEGGQSLSGGQRRRLALARSLLRRADVTILDEPTEGLEAEAAAALVAAVRAELAGRSLLWVTHRREGLEGFPKRLTLRAGRLV